MRFDIWLMVLLRSPSSSFLSRSEASGREPRFPRPNDSVERCSLRMGSIKYRVSRRHVTADTTADTANCHQRMGGGPFALPRTMATATKCALLIGVSKATITSLRKASSLSGVLGVTSAARERAARESSEESSSVLDGSRMYTSRHSFAACANLPVLRAWTVVCRQAW